ncbi:MAG TPA: glucosamine-6-phosphate deaminase [Chloroflexi bacterium]|nr:glucosamine-6-phosphate deaminase [Chloroflexota bacterium]
MKIVPERKLQVEGLRVEIYADRCQMGATVALRVAAQMERLLANKAQLSMVFAAAPSQNEFLSILSSLDGLPWDRVIAFHMDEYVGVTPEAPQSFRRYLKEHLFAKVRPGTVHLIRGEAGDLLAECKRYTELLKTYSVDIVCAGIGENGHLAFNDPGVADFADRATVKVVELDERCRAQQVHDGCFDHIDLVPRRAITLTLPALMAAQAIFCTVPGPRKAEAVKATVTGPIEPSCPATILRQHNQAILFLDRDSARLINA